MRKLYSKKQEEVNQPAEPFNFSKTKPQGEKLELVSFRKGKPEL